MPNKRRPGCTYEDEQRVVIRAGAAARRARARAGVPESLISMVYDDMRVRLARHSPRSREEQRARQGERRAGGQRARAQSERKSLAWNCRDG